MKMHQVGHDAGFSEIKKIKRRVVLEYIVGAFKIKAVGASLNMIASVRFKTTIRSLDGKVLMKGSDSPFALNATIRACTSH